MLKMPDTAFPRVRMRRSPSGKSPGRGAVGRGRSARTNGATRKRPAAAGSRRQSASAWFNRLLILTGAIVVIAAAIEAYLTLDSIPVQRIIVTGELAHTRYEAVQEMVQPALAGGFLNADLQLIRDQLQALPWIYQATVRRRWPNSLEIHVEEELPIARWGNAGFLNHEGEIFRPDSAERWQSLPLLQGPEGSASALVATYQRLVDLLRPLQLTVSTLSMDERGQVEVALGSGATLILGGDEFLERMQRFVTIYRTELRARFSDVQRVDLRYASGAAVAFRPDELVAGVEGK
jgi:cell division protein FtsQ